MALKKFVVQVAVSGTAWAVVEGEDLTAEQVKELVEEGEIDFDFPAPGCGQSEEFEKCWEFTEEDQALVGKTEVQTVEG
jgi:hypothetical protein